MASEGQLRMGVSCCGRTSLSLNFLICKMATGMGQGSGSGTGCLEQPLALSFGGHWTPAGHLCVYGRNAGNNSTCHPGLPWEPVRNRHKAPRRARHRACPRPTMAATPDGVKGMPGTPHPGGGEQWERQRASWAHVVGDARGHEGCKGRETDPCNSLPIPLQLHGAAAQEERKYALHTLNVSLMKTGRVAFLNCLALKSVTKTVGGSHRWSPGRGACRGRGQGGQAAGGQPAWSPLGLPEGAIWDFSEGHWDHVLVS